ncbi:retrovirus-related pol polyprotein from transposon TNT 1-94 [Tanacetum coccineum]
MNPTAASQIALDNALVPPEARLEIGECNRRIEFSKPQREATYQVTLDALNLSPCYLAFQITAGVPEIYMHPLWNTITKVKDSSSYQFKLDNKKFRVNAKVFRDILQICPKLPYRPFDIPPSTNEEILSSTGAFPGKPLALKNLGCQELKFYGGCITARMWILLNYSGNTLHSRSTITSQRKACPILDSQRSSSITSSHKTNILNSTAYKTYYAYTSGAKEPKKARKFKKPSLPKLKTVPVSPKEPTKKPGKAKKDVTSTKKIATKPKPTKKKTLVKADRGKGNGTDFESGVPDEQQGKISGANKGAEDDDDEDDTEDDDDDDNDGNDDDDDKDGEEYVDEFTDKEDDADNANKEYEEELDDAEELYKDVNMNLRKKDVEMTNVDQSGADQHNVSQESRFEQEEEDAHVTLTALRKKLLNVENISSADNEIASLMDTTVLHKNVSPADNEISSLMIHMQPPTPDLDWNKRQHVNFRPSQTWISNIACTEEPRTSFDELMDTPIDFSAFVINRLNITNLTQELLVVPAFNILKGTCKSCTELDDGMLNYVRTSFHDITSGIRIEYLPKRKWSGLDKRRACVMIQDIDKQLFQRRLMRNLEKFVGEREYREDLRLITRTI